MSTTKRGQAGGTAVVAKHGRAHMQDLARRWHDKYRLVPFDGNDFLIVDRRTGQINRKTLNGHIYNPKHK